MELGNSIKPLRNVGLLIELLTRVENRAFGLPGMATFHGPSGFGKTYACAYAAAKRDCIHISMQKMWTKKAFLAAILHEVGRKPERTSAEMCQQVNDALAVDGRSLIIDEADYAAGKGMIDIIRDIHDNSQTPIILVGMETLPQKLRKTEQVDSRMLSWVGAQGADLEDAKLLAALYAPTITIGEALMQRILRNSKGSARRISTDCAYVCEQAGLDGLTRIDLEEWGDRPLLSRDTPDARVML